MEALKNWKEEKRSAYLYKALSEIESNPVHKKLFLELSTLAEKQANIWQVQLQTIPPPYHPEMRVRFVLWLVQHFGARSLRIALAALKVRGMSIYLAREAHHPHPTPEAGVLESKHSTISKGNNIRAAVFGINDGLISNTSLILGIAGAQAGSVFILLSGVAGLLAGACSMAAGEYVSVRSQREMLEYQIELERCELELYPEEEMAELALIYEARGLQKEDAEKVAYALIQDPSKALDTLTREELGINPDDMISPWGAAISSFVAFGLGAFIPLIPFIYSNSSNNIYFSIGLTSFSLFSVGALLSIFTQRSALLSGLRMLFIGVLAGTLTYSIGSLFHLG